MEKSVQLLEACKSHSGPVTSNSLGLLDKLNEKQLLEEVKYLQATIALDIRRMRRIKITNGKLKMLTFSDHELRNSIKNAIRPGDSVDALLLNALSKPVYF